jgi:hypothetical protein
MAVEEVIGNLSGIVGSLPPHVVARISSLVTIFKAVGIAIIIYVIYVVVKFVINWKQAQGIKRIEKKLDSLERKIDFFVKGKNKKR